MRRLLQCTQRGPNILRSDDLPPAPKIAAENWLARLQAIAIVTVLFASVQSQLLGALPEDNHRASDAALRFLTYGGLFLNLGGTFSAVLLLLAITEMPSTARRLYVSCPHSYPRRMSRASPDTPDPAWEDGAQQDMLRKPEGNEQLLRAFGIARGWDIVLFHCIVSLIGGAVFTFAEIVLTAWIAERTVVAALVLPLAVFGLAPPLYVFFFLMGPHKCPQCDEERARANSSQSQTDFSRRSTGVTLPMSVR